MKKINKKSLIKTILSVLVLVAGVYLLDNGGKRSDVVLSSYAINEKGDKITLNVGVTSSIGYIRKAKVKENNGYKYITFYSTFGLNNKFGAKDSFEIDLKDKDQKIYFYKGNGRYKLVIKRTGENNNWMEVKPLDIISY